MVMIGLLGGFSAGIVTILVRDKIKDTLFSSSDIKSLVEWPLLYEFSSENRESWDEQIDFLVRGPFAKISGDFCLLQVGDIDSYEIDRFNQILNKYIKNTKILISKDIRKAMICPNILVLTAYDITTKKEIIDINNKFSLVNQEAIGIIAFKI